jgi:serine phosphatase RsbU (regulator of sigma subunit)/pSer/pThr/pTyr-binding forkhead associated (FHA) protein
MKDQAWVELMDAERGPRTLRITATPVEIGRGAPGPNRWALDDARISRKAARIDLVSGGFRVRDLGQLNGLYLNRQRVGPGEDAPLAEGDVISFGNAEGVRLVFHTHPARDPIGDLLSRLDESSRSDALDHLQQLSLLLEATSLLQTELPVEEVLGAMVDQAIRITAAERGALLAADPGPELRMWVARGADPVEVASWVPSRTAIESALAGRQAFIELDLDRAGDALRQAASIVSQRLRSVIAIPLYSPSRTARAGGGALLGLLYLDSRQGAAFRGLGRRVLDALATEAASVIDNARMVAGDRERRQMEQDLEIARGIQQKLLPKEFCRRGAFEVTGINQSCHSVGGDYFDLVDLDRGRLAFVIADVTGKGLPAALLGAILQGGFAGVMLTPDLARLVTHLNRYVWARSEPNRFATAFVGISGSSGHLDYINAGHLPALLIRGAGREVRRLESSGFPIGVFADTVFTATRLTLEPDDTLALFTDGVTEAVNAGGEEYGMERLVALLRDLADAALGDIQTSILAAIREFSGGQEPDDDRTLLLVRYLGSESS